MLLGFRSHLQRAARSGRSFVQRHRIQSALAWCIPALVIATILRIYLLAHHPAAYVHDDTASVLETPHDLVTRGALKIEGKKTPLVPVVYSVAAVVGVPVLPFAAAVQHLLGLVNILLTGLLVRAWFVRWQWFILPATLAMAVHPVLLWYEHVALAEIWAVTATLLVAVAAWPFYRRSSLRAFAFLLGSLLLIAFARPEGNLFCVFGIALVLRSTWGNLRRCAVYTGVTLAWSFLILTLTRTSQSGILLLASLVHLTPQSLSLSPGLAEAIAPVTASARAEWESGRVPRLTRIRKDLQAAVYQHLEASGFDRRKAEPKLNSTATRAGAEIFLRNIVVMPGFALEKFVIGHHEPPALGFNAYVVDGQREVLFNDAGEPEKGVRYAKLSWGRPLASAGEASAFFAETTRPVPNDWLWTALTGWVWITTRPLLPVALPGSQTQNVDLPGIPWLYTLALCGMILLAIRERPPGGYHLLLGGFLIAFFLVIMITANVRARFRVVFEPFWILYTLALFDGLWAWAHPAAHRRKRGESIPPPPASGPAVSPAPQ